MKVSLEPLKTQLLCPIQAVPPHTARTQAPPPILSLATRRRRRFLCLVAALPATRRPHLTSLRGLQFIRPQRRPTLPFRSICSCIRTWLITDASEEGSRSSGVGTGASKISLGSRCYCVANCPYLSALCREIYPYRACLAHLTL